MTPPTSARVSMSWDRPDYDALLTILEQTNSLAEAAEAILAAGWTPPRRGVLRLAASPAEYLEDLAANQGQCAY